MRVLIALLVLAVFVLPAEARRPHQKYPIPETTPLPRPDADTAQDFHCRMIVKSRKVGRDPDHIGLSKGIFGRNPAMNDRLGRRMKVMIEGLHPKYDRPTDTYSIVKRPNRKDYQVIRCNLIKRPTKCSDMTGLNRTFKVSNIMIRNDEEDATRVISDHDEEVRIAFCIDMDQ